MISFIKRVIIAIRIVLSKSKEPFFKFNYIINYVKNGYFFPSYEKVDYRPLIKIEMDENFKYVIFKGKRICYPKSWTNWLITENFNNLINEQTAVGANVNPHKYLSNSELKKEWVIYDIGAAEGSQSKLWIDDVKHIVLFEPLPSFFIQLQNTFKAEIDAGKVTLVNAGISDKRTLVSMEGESIVFDTLNNIVAEYKLPIPNYIKADIEGEELNFLNSSVSFIKKNKPELIQITTYHRPTDHITIPNYFSSFEGNGSFSDGVMVFNRDGMVNGSYRKKIYHPIIRKCLYSFRFNH